jgi:pyruvate dehydrogenase E1 component alpha subunit
MEVELHQRLYRAMRAIRRFEETAYDLYGQRVLLCPIHASIGQEAVAVGVCDNLRLDDLVVSNHRGHGHAVAKGAPVDRLLAELCARATGVCRGKGGSMQIADMAHGVAGSNGIDGAGLPIATGLAWAQQVRKTGNVVAVFFGDGASSQGMLHESLNLASLWKLPVLFVCENNRYAVYVRVEDSIAGKRVAARAAGYEMSGITVDGMDVLAVRDATAALINGPGRAKGPPSWKQRRIGSWVTLGGTRATARTGPRRNWRSGWRAIRSASSHRKAR